MSLISEALNKVQRERDTADQPKIQIDNPLNKPKNKIISNPKLVILSFGIITIFLLIYLTVFMEKKVLNNKTQPFVTTNQAGLVIEKVTPPPNIISKKENSKNQKKTIANPKPVKDDISKNKRVLNGKVSLIESKKIEEQPKINLKEKATQMFNSQNYQEAITCYRKILSEKKEEEIFLKLYSCYKKLDNSIMANYYITLGLETFPDSFYLNKISTVINIREKNYLKAGFHIKKAIKIISDDYVLYTYLGLCNFHQQKYELALENFHRSLKLNQNSVENIYYIGLILDNKQEFIKALDYYKYFLKVNSNNQYFKHQKWILNRIEILERSLRSR